MNDFGQKPLVSTLEDIPRYVSSLGYPIEAVAFDVFDTLLWRCATERRVRSRATAHVVQSLASHGFDVTRLTWVEEERARFVRRQQDEVRRHGLEWSYRDWYAHLARQLNVSEEELVAKGCAAELEAERTLTRAAPSAGSVIERLRQCGHQVVAVSDSQHRSETLVQLLESHGLHMDRVWSSASVGATKRVGNLFRVVVGDLGIRPAELLHVGDNLKADVLRASAAGCRFLWLPRTPARSSLILKQAAGLDCRNLEDIRNALDAPEAAVSDHQGFAYTHLAPILALHSLWFRNLVEEHEITDAIYVARDGRTLMEVHELLEDCVQLRVKRHYLHISRRVVTLAHPDDLLFDVRDVTGKSSRRTVGEYLAQFYLPETLKRRLLASAGLQESNRLNSGTRRRFAMGLREQEAAVRREQRRQASLLRDYVLQELPSEAGKVALVDAGWAGTIQDTLRHVLPERISLIGAYLGVSEAGRPGRPGSRKFGLLWDVHRRKVHNPVEKSAGVIRVWELLLANAEGPTRFLERDELGSVVPVGPENATRSNREREIIASIRSGLRQGLKIRREGVRCLADFGRGWPRETWTQAAVVAAGGFTTFPDRTQTRILTRLDFHDDLSGGESSGLGIEGISEGIAWYPGLASRIGGLPLQVLIYLAACFLSERGEPKS